MSDEEIALQLTNIYITTGKGVISTLNYRENLFNDYIAFLENLKNYKSQTIKGQIEELLYEYNHRHDYCEFIKDRLIEDIEKVIKEDE